MTKALVLGPGGPVGTAWMAGLAVGLRRAGVDLAEADLIVGTSAGAIVGAVLATGQDPERLASLPRSAKAEAPGADAARLNEVFAVLGDQSLTRRRPGDGSAGSPSPPRSATRRPIGPGWPR